MSLTERALAHAHVAQCAGCQAERAAIALAVIARPSVAASPPATAHVIGQVRLLIARVAPPLFRLHATSRRALQAGARAARATTSTEMTRLLGVPTRLRLLTSSSLTLSTRVTVRAIEGVWARLVRMASRLPTLVVAPARVAAGLFARARAASTGARRPLMQLGSTVMIACHGAARAASEVASSVLGLVSRSFGRTVRAAGMMAATGWLGAMRTMDVLARVGGRLPSLLAPSTRAVGHIVGTIPARARFASAGARRLLTQLGSTVMIACHGAPRAAGEAAGTVLGLVSRSLGGTVSAAWRVVATCYLGAMRTMDVLGRVAGRLSSLVAPAARAVGHIVGTIPARARVHPRVCAGIVSGVLLVSSITFLGPRLQPDNLAPRFSPDERLLRETDLPVDRKPVEPIGATPLAIQVERPRPVPGPQPIPARRVAAPEVHAAIPAPVRRSTPAAAEATPTAEASDPAAAIDWLLKSSGRRPAESP